MKNMAMLSVQILLLVLVSQLGYFVAGLLPLPLPGNVLGMLFMLVLLWSGVLPLYLIEKGSLLLVQHIGLFVVPIAVGLMSFGDLFLETGLVILLALAVSLVVGICVTGLVAQRLVKPKREERHGTEFPDHAV
jgi:holin-like protein